MSVVVTVLHVIVCVFLIAVVLLQRGKGAQVGAVFGGGGGATMFGGRGAGNFLTKLTTGAAVVFMLTSLSLAYMRIEPRRAAVRGRSDRRGGEPAPKPAAVRGDRQAARPRRPRQPGAAPPADAPAPNPRPENLRRARAAPMDRARCVRYAARLASRGSGGTGRRTSLRGWQGQPCGGSNPLCRTTRLHSRPLRRRCLEIFAMAQNQLEQVARSLVAPGKGILAADESSGTIEKRLKSIQTPSTEENRRAYREMLFRTEGAEQFVSGVILYDETIRQKAADGTPLREGALEQGHPARHQGRRGHEGARRARRRRRSPRVSTACGERLASTAASAPKFAKWRAVITIGDGIPTDYCLDTNAHALARYAALCVEARHRADRRARGADGRAAHDRALLRGHRAHAARRCSTSCSTSACRSSRSCSSRTWCSPAPSARRRRASPQVAEATLHCFRRVVPAAVPGIVFLSGGQSDELATAHLSKMNELGGGPVGALVLLRPRAPGARAEGVGRQARERRGGPEGLLPPREAATAPRATASTPQAMEKAA